MIILCEMYEKACWCRDPLNNYLHVFSAVERENDELLALLDIQERSKYEKSRSISSEDEYCTYNSTEVN